MDKEQFLGYQLELEKRLAAQREELIERLQELAAANSQRSDVLLRELSDARVDLRGAKDSLSIEFEKSKHEAAELAVSRTLALFTEAKNIIQIGAGVLLAMVFGAGYLAYSSLQSTTAKFVDLKVKDWLSVSTGDSPVKATLEELRTHAVLDAWTVRLARQTIDGRKPIGVLGLGSDELARLRQIMLNPNSPRIDFLDAARLITASRGFAASLSIDADITKVARSILTEKSYDDQRRADLLMVWWKDVSLTPLTKVMLEDRVTKYPDEWLVQAFNNLSRYAPKDALKFAPGLLLGREDDTQTAVAAFLARTDPLNDGLQRWIKGLAVSNPDRYEITLASFASSAVPNVEKKRSVGSLSQAAAWLFEAIQRGAELRLSAGGIGSNLAWQRRIKGVTYIAQVDDARAYLEMDDLLTRVLHKATNIHQLATAVSALEVPDNDGMFASIEMAMSEASSLTVKGRGKDMGKSDVVGLVRLHVSHEGDEAELMATWRQPNGEFVTGQVVSARFGDASFSYAYDRDKAAAFSMRKIEEYF